MSRFPATGPLSGDPARPFPGNGGLRAVVSDLDGTLLLSGARLGEATVEALRGLEEAGIPFLVATGRSVHGLGTLGEARRLVRIAICSSGAIGYDPAAERFLWRRHLDPALTARVVRALLDTVPGVGIGSFDGEAWAVTASYHDARGVWPSGPRRVVGPEDLSGADGCALVVAHAELTSEEIAGRLLAAGVGPAEATVTWAGPNLLDVVPPDVDKAYGIRRAAALLELAPEAFVAFGDGPNDLPMLEAVGLGVAVDNAHPDVLRVADRVTASNDEEGVAQTLRELGLVRRTAA